MATNKPLTAQSSNPMPNKDVILAFQNMLVINIDEIRKLGKNDGWDSPSMYNTGKPILDWGDLPKQQNEFFFDKEST